MARTITSMTCQSCGEIKADTLRGMCEECESDHVYCGLCKRWYSYGDECRHVIYVRDTGDYIGPGVYTDESWLRRIQASVFAVLDKTQIAEPLACAIHSGNLSMQFYGTIFGYDGVRCDLRNGAEWLGSFGDRFTSDLTEEQEEAMSLGVQWLVALDKNETRKANRQTLQWISEWQREQISHV